MLQPNLHVAVVMCHTSTLNGAFDPCSGDRASKPHGGTLPPVSPRSFLKNLMPLVEMEKCNKWGRVVKLDSSLATCIYIYICTIQIDRCEYIYDYICDIWYMYVYPCACVICQYTLHIICYASQTQTIHLTFLETFLPRNVVGNTEIAAAAAHSFF